MLRDGPREGWGGRARRARGLLSAEPRRPASASGPGRPERDLSPSGPGSDRERRRAAPQHPRASGRSGKEAAATRAGEIPGRRPSAPALGLRLGGRGRAGAVREPAGAGGGERGSPDPSPAPAAAAAAARGARGALPGGSAGRTRGSPPASSRPPAPSRASRVRARRAAQLFPARRRRLPGHARSRPREAGGGRGGPSLAPVTALSAARPGAGRRGRCRAAVPGSARARAGGARAALDPAGAAGWGDGCVEARAWAAGGRAGANPRLPASRPGLGGWKTETRPPAGEAR